MEDLLKIKHLLELSAFGLKSIFFSLKKPILGTIIVTDYCNLHCKHCVVNNINKVMYGYEKIVDEMQRFYKEGIRILFLSGGETMLWEDHGFTVKDLIKKGREIGFYIINIVTNGTVTLDVPEADMIFLSLDGLQENHNRIRGDVYETVMKNAAQADNSNICVYSAINTMNYHDIQGLCELTARTKNLNSISFNFHTPYRLTEELCLSMEQRREAVNTIKAMIYQGYPIFNLPSALDLYLENDWERPCPQCIVSENDKRYICGRCSEIPGLCEQCGYLFAVEFSVLFHGNIRAIMDMYRVYTRYV
jgi:Fe-coproporphyrin III synthase